MQGSYIIDFTFGFVPMQGLFRCFCVYAMLQVGCCKIARNKSLYHDDHNNSAYSQCGHCSSIAV
jgi:hypothetical protein